MLPIYHCRVQKKEYYSRKLSITQAYLSVRICLKTLETKKWIKIQKYTLQDIQVW